MAKTTYTMRALRTFEGNEGLIRRGDIFEVENKERVAELERLQLAEKADGEEVTNVGQLNAQLEDASRSDLESEADSLNVNYTDDTTDDQLRTSISRQREVDYNAQSAALTQGTNQPAAGTTAAASTATGTTSTSSTSTSGDSA